MILWVWEGGGGGNTKWQMVVTLTMFSCVCVTCVCVRGVVCVCSNRVCVCTLHVCVCVCVDACHCMCVCACIHVHTYAHMHAHVYTCTYTCHIYICKCMWLMREWEVCSVVVWRKQDLLKFEHVDTVCPILQIQKCSASGLLLLSPFLIGRMFLHEPSWKYLSKLYSGSRKLHSTCSGNIRPIRRSLPLSGWEQSSPVDEDKIKMDDGVARFFTCFSGNLFICWLVGGAPLSRRPRMR